MMSNLYLVLAILFGLNGVGQDDCSTCPDFSKTIVLDANAVSVIMLDDSLDSGEPFHLKDGVAVIWDEKDIILKCDGKVIQRYRKVGRVEHDGYPYLKTKRRFKTWYIQPNINPISNELSISIHNDKKKIDYIYTGPYRYE